MRRPLAQMRVLSQAHAVALQAKCGLLRQDQVAALAQATQATLGDDDPVKASVTAFLAAVQLTGRQPVALRAAGDGLQMAVRRALWPDASDRSDIHG